MRVLFVGLLVLGGCSHEEPEVVVPIIEETIQVVDEKDLQCLAMNIYHEARGESLAGQVAVADVVLNRVDDRRYPNTICDVVYQAKLSEWWIKFNGAKVPVKNKCQFSWYCDGKDDTPTRGYAWSNAQTIARNMLTRSEYRGITEGSTHYHASYVNPYWVRGKGMRLVSQIGEHIFYTWKY